MHKEEFHPNGSRSEATLPMHREGSSLGFSFFERCGQQLVNGEEEEHDMGCTNDLCSTLPLQGMPKTHRARATVIVAVIGLALDGALAWADVSE